MADQIADPCRVNEGNEVDFSGQYRLRDNVPAPSYVTSPGPFGDTELGLRPFAKQPSDEVLQRLCLREIRAWFSGAFATRWAKPTLRTGGR